MQKQRSWFWSVPWMSDDFDTSLPQFPTIQLIISTKHSISNVRSKMQEVPFLGHLLGSEAVSGASQLPDEAELPYRDHAPTMICQPRDVSCGVFLTSVCVLTRISKVFRKARRGLDVLTRVKRQRPGIASMLASRSTLDILTIANDIWRLNTGAVNVRNTVISW